MTQLQKNSELLAGVELGGTKCICTLGTGPHDIRAQIRLPTGEPEATLAELGAVLDEWGGTAGAIRAIGLASFGPLDLRAGSATFGHIKATTKPGWAGVDVVGRLGKGRGVPVGFDTDVNGAALAEQRWGAAQGLADFAYITVGTGVGVGLMVGGRRVFGGHHTELGHMRVARSRADPWPGACAFHRDCVEGLASGTALAARAHMAAELIPGDSPVWEFAAHALAQLVHNIILATAPLRVLVGGGVPHAHPELLARMRRLLTESMCGYLDLDDLFGEMDAYLISPGLGSMAGPLGPLALAAEAADASD